MIICLQTANYSDITVMTENCRMLTHKNFSWNCQIDQISKITDLMVQKLHSLNILNSQIEPKFKIRLYYSVFVSSVSYAAYVWFPDVELKSSYLTKLRTIQHRYLRNLFGLYKHTSYHHLFKLTSIVDIVSELQISVQSLQLPRGSRRKFKLVNRQDTLNSLLVTPVLAIDHTVTETLTHRYSLWCLTGAGPFREFLHKLKLVENPACRYCGFPSETSSHLLNYCKRFNSAYSLGHILIHIVKTLQTDSNLS